MGTRTGKRPFSFCIHPHRKAFHVSIRRSCAVPSGRQRRAFVASLGVALLGTPKLALANSLIDAFIMRMGLAWLLAPPLGLRIHRNLCGAGSGAGSARPHRLRLPPAMGERKLAREAIALAPESFDP